MVKELQPVYHKAVIELMDGSWGIINYHLLMEKFGVPDNNSNIMFNFSSFLDHRMTKKGKWELKVEWDGVSYEPSWELSHMIEADPISYTTYTREHKLMNVSRWKGQSASRLMHLE